MEWNYLKRVSVILIVASIFILSSCSSDKRAEGNNATNNNKSNKTKVIKLSHSHQRSFSSEIHTAAWLFKQWIEDNSDVLEVKIYPSGSLGSEREVYEAMQVGSGASCIISGTAILNNFVPETGVLDFPYLWESYRHIHKTLDGKVGDTLSNKLSKSGFKVLSWMDSWGYRNIVTADPISENSDIKGMKIRTIQSETYMKTIKMMGANSTPMAFGEVYTGMQTGVLDGFEHNATVVKANKFYEVADHIALTEHIFGPLVMIFSKKEWKRLSDDQQSLIKEAANFAQEIERALTPIKEKEAISFLKDKGMEVHKINKKPFMEKATDLQNSLASDYNATDLLKMIRKNK